MFIRIYSSLLLSVLIAALLSYGFYSWQYQHRYHNYLQSVFSGSLYLLNKGLDRHTGAKQQRWLDVMERIAGSSIQVSPSPFTEEASLSFQRIAADGVELIYRQGMREIRTEITQVSEQHYRMMATLIRNELGRVAESRQARFVEQALSNHFPNLELISLVEVSLDPQQLSRLKRFDTVVIESGHHQSYVYSRVTQGDGVIKIGPIMGFNPLPISSMVLMMIMGLLITALSAYLLVFSIERRVKSIQHGVNEFSKAPTQLPKLDEDADVIGRLAWSINSMSFRIYRLLSDQKQIIQAISHELRTPMSRMKFRLQVLEDERLTKAGEKSIKGMRKDIDEVNDLIHEALEFDRGSLTHHITRVDLVELLKLVIQDLKVEFVATQIEFDANIPASITKQDSQQLKRLIQNIIQNACKYGNGKVVIRLLEQKESWLLKIEDNGPGIPDEMKLSIFSPFTRLETSRNKLTGGMGLGLAIADNIAQLAGIELTLEDSHLGGACFNLVMAKMQISNVQELG